MPPEDKREGLMIAILAAYRPDFTLVTLLVMAVIAVAAAAAAMSLRK